MKDDETAKVVGGLFALLLLPIVLIFWLFGLSGPETTSNFARQGYGGKWRRVSKDEVDSYVVPLLGLFDRIKAMGDVPLEDMLPYADRIDEACDRFDEQNFSFAHKRRSDEYNRMIRSFRESAVKIRTAAQAQA